MPKGSLSERGTPSGRRDFFALTVLKNHEETNAMGRRYPSQEDEIRTALEAAEKVRAS